MTGRELEVKIRDALSAAHLDGKQPDVRVQPDPYRGWNIAVVTDQFKPIAAAARRDMLSSVLQSVDVAWLDMLTPDEAQWAGPLPGDIEPPNLPLWPEALARASVGPAITVTLASDLDDDLSPPLVVTFYSLRGGVGRSTALAHTARILASRRKKVVCVDMDLEAPALPVLLGCDHMIESDQGVVDLLMGLDQGAKPDFASHILPVPDADGLFVVPAGRVSADYARKLRFLNPSAWYREHANPLRMMVDGLKESLPFRPDAILLDARTGITDLSGPLLFDLADIAVVAFFPHPQAKSGTELLARSLMRTCTRREFVDGRRVVPDVRFLVSPIPAASGAEVRRRYERRPLEWIEDWLEPFNAARTAQGLEPVAARDITHTVTYREDIATSDGIAGAQAASPAFQPVADWIQRFLTTQGEVQGGVTLKRSKDQILQQLAFSAGTAEDQTNLLEDFVQTDRVEEALSADTPLVTGRKGTGKTAVFRVLSERVPGRAVVVHAPSALRRNRGWQLSSDGFATADDILRHSTLGWRHFWTLYVAVALDAAAANSTGRGPQRPPHLANVDLALETDVIQALDLTVASTRGPLDLQGWLRRLDEASQPETLLLFDGLDTGFGSTEQERDRRRRSVEGLFDAWMDVGQGLSNLRFKIMLREDIWRQLNFANKSHLYGRTVSLKWSDQVSFLKVVTKQAMRAEAFKSLPTIVERARDGIDTWSDDDVNRAWVQLVGERMKGGQTAYTRNWVWNRLADANADHSPRHLLQLFREAVQWERNEEARSPYEKTVIRPRALTACLAEVSDQAVEALEEEFAELQPLLAVLRRQGRTPVEANSLAQHPDLIGLAREVGLLDVYEETADEVHRYKVPDLYRQGLGMTRRGPG